MKIVIIITGRNEVVAKVMFLHVSVILSTGGVSAEPPPGTKETPPAPRRPPRTRENPPRDQADPPRPRRPPRDQGDPPPTCRETPRDQGEPPGTKETPPAGRTPPPLREEDCSIRSMSGRYVSYWNAFLL